MKNTNLGRRIYASTVATIVGGVATPFLTLEALAKGIFNTVIDTVETPVDSIKNKEFVEAPFDMANSAVSGVLETACDVVKTTVMSPVIVGAEVYCALAGEDANPKTVEFVEKYSA